ncbi:hypothetical protein GALMADRAFT_219786 [Galerina marginata CBS 339.88]|uniref:CCD97-like C-terminal domain-containing protein n=1 Tax=Galerina marginata (strain CBS 339.88) TaxID=685588 RepID=A0A067TY68_GALM3|nr:hypothetical protein GALMADRAFT_219786 [Galerina marginata CBS 339.88]
MVVNDVMDKCCVARESGSAPGPFTAIAPSLKYLGLPEDFTPSPDTEPIEFLSQYLSKLPPHILQHYSYITTPKQRTVIIPIRNRRLHYANENPPELRFESGRSTWPELWQGRERRGVAEANEERFWVQQGFLQGNRQHVGKLANLLADYEEEREAERVRNIRRSRAPVEDDFVPEEDTDSDEDAPSNEPPEIETEAQAKSSFEKLLRERFIYGLLDDIDYDKVDWDETLGVDDDREAEDRWFDEDDD